MLNWLLRGRKSTNVLKLQNINKVYWCFKLLADIFRTVPVPKSIEILKVDEPRSGNRMRAPLANQLYHLSFVLISTAL